MRPWLINLKGNPCGFLMISLFENCMIFMSVVISMFSRKIENMSFSKELLQKLLIFDDSRDATKGEILNISRDM